VTAPRSLPFFRSLPHGDIDPFLELRQMQSEMNEVFSEFTPVLNVINQVFSGFTPAVAPPIDIWLGADSVVVKSRLPGVTPNDLNQGPQKDVIIEVKLERLGTDRAKQIEVAMAHDDNRFRQAVLKQLERWAESNPHQAVLGAADSGKPLTRRDVYTHVRENTRLGAQLMEGWEDLAAEYVLESRLE
jgi:hypothetical protein